MVSKENLMGKTITEKIIANHLKSKTVAPDDFVVANVDFGFGHDLTSPIAIQQFKKIGRKKVFDANKVALIPDHLCPTRDIGSAELNKMVRNFAYKQEVNNPDVVEKILSTPTSPGLTGEYENQKAAFSRLYG